MDPLPPSTNPLNDEPTVLLLDQAGGEVTRLSQRQAARLLRRGYAELVAGVPPAVRLAGGGPPSSPADLEAMLSDAGQAGLKAQYLHARRGALYGNVHFEGPDGQTMFHGDAEKALWYLNRGLVDVVRTDPPVLRFRFAPGGAGHAGDEYYLTGKQNRCVVCGATQGGLNRHHVVPSVYRRHLPPEIKDHSHHDVLLLCLPCHEKYEAEADRLKTTLGAEHGVPPHGIRGEADRERGRAIKLAHALVEHGERIPAARREEMLRVIGDWSGRWPLGEADVREVAALNWVNGEVVEHGERVVAQTADVQAFLRRWREHFLHTMRPQFLPDHWDVDRPASRE